MASVCFGHGLTVSISKDEALSVSLCGLKHFSLYKRFPVSHYLSFHAVIYDGFICESVSSGSRWSWWWSSWNVVWCVLVVAVWKERERKSHFVSQRWKRRYLTSELHKLNNSSVPGWFYSSSSSCGSRSARDIIKHVIVFVCDIWTNSVRTITALFDVFIAFSCFCFYVFILCVCVLHFILLYFVLLFCFFIKFCILFCYIFICFL